MPYFQAFQPVSVTVTFFMNSITFVMNHLFSYFDISICHSSNRTLSYRLLLTHSFNHGYILGGACYIHLTMKTNVYYKQILPCIQMFPLKRLPTIGSPMRSFLFIHTLYSISLHDTFMQYIFSFVMIFFSSVNSIISPSTLYWSLSMPYGMKYVVTIERISSF